MAIVFHKNGFDYYKRIINGLNFEIDQLSNDDILNTDFEEMVEYYVNKHKVELIELYLEDKVDLGMEETKIPEPHPFIRNETIYVDAYSIQYKIPFSGDSNLLYLQATQAYSYTQLTVDQIISPSNEECGYILFSIQFKVSRFNNQPDFAEVEFKNNFKYIKDSIDYINNDFISYNNQLDNNVRTFLNNRKKRAEKVINTSQILNIALKKSEYAPNTIPIKLTPKKILIPPTQRKSSLNKEYAINDSDYTNINNIINMSCTSMEKAAKSLNRLEEEELRDIILATLNTHYENATGETFSKSGKTDIYLPFENKAAYIGECKIWKGEKVFTDALNQLFSYTTWRDIKTSLILFNKSNKDFIKTTETLHNSIENNELIRSNKRKAKNIWETIFLKDKNSSEIIIVRTMIFDLYIDK